MANIRIKQTGRGHHAPDGPERFTALKHVRVGDRFYEPGERVPVSGRRAQLMIARGELAQQLGEAS